MRIITTIMISMKSQDVGFCNNSRFICFLVPPQEVKVVDERTAEMTSLMIGPYNEGSSLRLTCISKGGKVNTLPPTLIWR